MASVETIVDFLLGADSGRIAAANLVEGLRLGHVDEAFFKAILHWWGEFAIQTSKSEGEIGACLGFLCKLYRGPIPSGFVPPSNPLPNPHIYCRRPEGLAADAPGVSVRDAAIIGHWTTANDLNELNDDGIDLTSKPGQVAYDTLAAADASVRVRRMRIEPGRTLTNPFAGPDGILFFTDASTLLTLLNSQEFSKKADSARDRLGLVHLRKGPQVAAVVFPSPLAENRPDRGRPTAVDAGGNSRFRCEVSDGGWEPGWGRTADLERLAAGLSGLPERICGPFPWNETGQVEVEVHLLGSVRLPRGDPQGVGDTDFADFLEGRIIRNFGTPLKEVIIGYLS